MSLQSCREEVAVVINDYVNTFGAGNDIKTNSEIEKIIKDRGVKLDTMFLVSDMCYNKTNKANLRTYPDDVILFEYVSRGNYRILGENYPYTGDVIWTKKDKSDQVVGRWDKGVLEFWGEGSPENASVYNRAKANDSQYEFVHTLKDDVTIVKNKESGEHMRKGIYCIKNGKGKIMSYDATDDLDAAREKIENKTGLGRNLKRYLENRPDAELIFEEIKETENPEIEILEYWLPKISRVIYSEKLLEVVADKKYRIRPKNVINAVEWFCEAFPSQEFSIEFITTNDNELAGVVKRNGTDYELYKFGGSGTPNLRADMEK